MTQRPGPSTIDDLPATLPIFPLPGVLLLPRGRLPLNIFEPRYLAMTEDALRADRLIGMIQPEDPEASLAVNPAGAQAAVYGVGCAGRITQFSETDDGRYLISLIGVCRFRVMDELPLTTGGYRSVHASFAPYAQDLEPPAQVPIPRAELIALVKEDFERKGLGANWDSVDQAGDDALVTALAMVCPFAPSEKQALLESPDMVRRAGLLLALLQMGARATTTADTKPQ